MFNIYRLFTLTLYVNGAVLYKCLSMLLPMCDKQYYWIMEIIDVYCGYSDCVHM